MPTRVRKLWPPCRRQPENSQSGAGLASSATGGNSRPLTLVLGLHLDDTFLDPRRIECSDPVRILPLRLITHGEPERVQRGAGGETIEGTVGWGILAAACEPSTLAGLASNFCTASSRAEIREAKSCHFSWSCSRSNLRLTFARQVRAIETHKDYKGTGNSTSFFLGNGQSSRREPSKICSAG